MAKDKPLSAGQMVQAVQRGFLRPEWATVGTANAGTSLWPYNANVQWQNTSSNSTDCNAATALSLGVARVS